MNNLKRILGMGMLLVTLGLTGCSSDSASEDADTVVPSLNQAAYIPGTKQSISLDIIRYQK